MYKYQKEHGISNRTLDCRRTIISSYFGWMASEEYINKNSYANLQLKIAMEKNNITKWETPNGVKITLVEDGKDKIVKEFNEALFKAFNLDLWEEYCEEVTKKGKAGYVRITLPKKGENND